MSRKRQKPKFRVGQVVRVANHYWRITKYEYSADRMASWDNGNWYEDWSGSVYSEHAMRPLTAREIGPRSGGRKR